MKHGWQNFFFGVVLALIGFLFYKGFIMLSDNSGISFFILSSAVALLIFSTEVFFGKRTENTLKDIKQDVKEMKTDIKNIKEILNKIVKNEPTVDREKK